MEREDQKYFQKNIFAKNISQKIFSPKILKEHFEKIFLVRKVFPEIFLISEKNIFTYQKYF